MKLTVTTKTSHKIIMTTSVSTMMIIMVVVMTVKMKNKLFAFFSAHGR